MCYDAYSSISSTFAFCAQFMLPAAGYADNLYNYFIYYSHFLTWITIIFNKAAHCAQPSHLACLNNSDIKYMGLMSELFINVHKIEF